ncbi:hypothetical protein BGZ70_000496 [Mortierella alpina]|uniref:C2H2-type domain-containing protein n=1 Tax=Mortierella alpina TaxID=64518 RepID=A0A9P6LYI5_MORAP|nr:hypothetical protein BGZ70_000496 [Mortierella alpina]
MGHPRTVAQSDEPLLSQQPLLSLDELGWFNSPASTDATASALPVPATSHQKSDTSGFDNLSPFDDVCASAFNTPFSPYLDTPDQTPNQTPLFDFVASEDIDTTSLEQFWDASAPNAAAQGSSLDQDLTSPALTTTSQSSHSAAQDPSDLNARLQAENALLDFVLFDDIAPPSPISTFTTPMTTTLPSPSFDLKEIENRSLAMQLVAAAAASMTSESLAASAQVSPFASGSSDVIGSLFSDVDFSPLMDTTFPATASSSPQLSMDFTSTPAPETLSFDFNNLVGINDSASAILNVFGRVDLPTFPLFPLDVTTPQVDLDLLLSLYSQQQQSLLSASTVSMATASEPSQPHKTEKSLKRKSDATEHTGEESPRQFSCAVCGRSFSRLFNLNTHERTHDRSKARLFACPEQGCKKSFTRKNDLQRHQISIHGVTHIYSCQKCNKPFSRRDALRRHMDFKDCNDDQDSTEHDHAS